MVNSKGDSKEASLIGVFSSAAAFWERIKSACAGRQESVFWGSSPKSTLIVLSKYELVKAVGHCGPRALPKALGPGRRETEAELCVLRAAKPQAVSVSHVLVLQEQ